MLLLCCQMECINHRPRNQKKTKVWISWVGLTWEHIDICDFAASENLEYTWKKAFVWDLPVYYLRHIYLFFFLIQKEEFYDDLEISLSLPLLREIFFP